MSFEIKFYNAGDRIQDYLPFTIDGGHDNACIGKYPLHIPAKDFFYVPVTIPAGSGEIAVRFAEDILRRYPNRGLIRIEPNYKGDVSAHLPIAKTDQEAIDKGNEFWNQYLDSIISRWISQCEQQRTNGGAPQEASGFTKRALKLRGIADPGAAAREAAMRAASTANGSQSTPGQAVDLTSVLKTIADLQAQIADMKRTSQQRVEADAETDRMVALDQELEQAESPRKSKK